MAREPAEAQKKSPEMDRRRGQDRLFCGLVNCGSREIEAVVVTHSWRALASILRTSIHDVRETWSEEGPLTIAADVPGGKIAAANPGRVVICVNYRWMLDGHEARTLASTWRPGPIRERRAPAAASGAGAGLHAAIYLLPNTAEWLVRKAIQHGVSPEDVIEQIVEAAAVQDGIGGA